MILDFGLIAELLPQHAGDVSSRDAAARPPTCHPRKRSGATPSEASDWYGVGVTLYEALTGALPFAGTVLDVLLRKRIDDPPAPAEVVPDVPADLSAICMGLLRRDPEQRLSGPEALRATGSRHCAARSEVDAGGRDPRHAIRRPRSSASGVERRLRCGRRAGTRRPCRSTVRQASARARWCGAFSASSARATTSSCSPAAATRTSRCRTRRSTASSTT